MQKLSKIKINLFMNSFQGVPSQVACSKLGYFTVSINICCYLQNFPSWDCRLLILQLSETYLFCHSCQPDFSNPPLTSNVRGGRLKNPPPINKILKSLEGLFQINNHATLLNGQIIVDNNPLSQSFFLYLSLLLDTPPSLSVSLSLSLSFT